MGKYTLGLCCQDNGEMTLEYQFDMAKRLGFHRVQLSMWVMNNLTEEHAAKTKKLLDSYGLECSELWCGWTKPAYWNIQNGPSTLGLVPSAYRFQRLQDLLKGATYAKKLGIKEIITHLGFIPQDPDDSNYRGLIHALQFLTEELEKTNQSFCFETGQETPVVVRRCIEDVGAKNIGVNYDPANLMIYGNGNPLDGLDLLGDYIHSVHVKDGTYPTSGYVAGVESVMGEGQVDIPAFLKKLRDLHFDGPMYIEHEREGITGKKKEEEILYAKQYVEKLL